MADNEEPIFQISGLGSKIQRQHTPFDMEQSLSELAQIVPPTEDLVTPSPLLAMYCLWQDEDWITASLHSIYPHVARILCLFNTHPWAGVGTYQKETELAVRNFPDPKYKITIERGDWDDPIWGGQLLQRSVGFTYCEWWKIPWLFLVDGDEIYPNESLIDIRRWTRTTQADTGRVPCLSFWQDCFTLGWKEHMSRLFRYKPGAYFSKPNTVSYK